MTVFKPHAYQQRAINEVMAKPFIGLFMQMGLGKTVVALTAASQLIYSEYAVSRVLVIAPKKVAEDTWSREAAKWEHLSGLTIAKILGTPAQRIAAAESDADVYVINRDNVVWLVDRYFKRWRWDMAVIDELSSFKNPQSKRFRALRKVRPLLDRVVGLTGTPSPNGLMDLWAQIFLLDRGERLGRTLGAYRQEFFTPGKHSGYVVYEWAPRKHAAEQITDKIKDITLSMQSADYIDLPERVDNIIPVRLDAKAMRAYKTMEQEAVLSLQGKDVTAASAAAVMGKLLQLSGGAVYDEEGEWHDVHSAKLDALEEMLSTATSPVLVFYAYKHEAERIKSTCKAYSPRELNTSQDIADWNAGRIELLIAHPASVGYGLNLQDGGHIIVWYGLPWSLELYQQANARLHRQGQSSAVIVNHLIAEGTADEKVMACLQRKDLSQSALMSALGGVLCNAPDACEDAV